MSEQELETTETITPETVGLVEQIKNIVGFNKQQPTPDATVQAEQNELITISPADLEAVANKKAEEIISSKAAKAKANAVADGVKSLEERIAKVEERERELNKITQQQELQTQLQNAGVAQEFVEFISSKVSNGELSEPETLEKYLETNPQYLNKNNVVKVSERPRISTNPTGLTEKQQRILQIHKI